MPTKIKGATSGGTASPKRASASLTVGKRTTPWSAQPDAPKSAGTSKRSTVSPIPRASTASLPSKTKRKVGASPSTCSPETASPDGSRRPSRRRSATTSPLRSQSTGASPSCRQSASTLHPSCRNSVDPLQPEWCTVDGMPLSHLRRRLSKTSAPNEQASLSMPADHFLSALTAMNSGSEAHEVRNSFHPAEDPAPRTAAAAGETSVLARASAMKPADPERVDELTSTLESIRNEAHIRVSVNDLVAFEYVDPSSHFWRWGLGTVAALPGPRLAQLMLWSASGMSDIPTGDCPLTPVEREAAMRELEEVRQKRDDYEIIVEEFTKKLHTLTATYRAERHEHHQEMEVAEHTLREARQEVRSLDEKDWRECRSYVNPPDIVEFILGAVMCVLGEHTSSWSDTLRIVRSRDFIGNITDFDPSSISPASKRTLQRTYLTDKRFTYQNAINGSRALGALLLWVTAQTATLKASKTLQKLDLSRTNQQEEMTEVQRRLDMFRKALADLDDNEDTLLEKLGDRQERARFAATPRPTDVAAAQAAAAAPSTDVADSEALRDTRRTRTFTDESLIVLRSAILVNYDTPDSTTVQLTDEQVEQLKKSLQARAAPYVQEKQAENKQRRLEEEIAKLRGNMAEAKSELDKLKSAQNEHEKALAAKERAIEDLHTQLGVQAKEAYPDGEGGEAPSSGGPAGAGAQGKDDMPQDAKYLTEDGAAPVDASGGEPADRNQARALASPQAASSADAVRDAGAPSGDAGKGEGGAPAGGPHDDRAAKAAPEALKALEDALAEKEKEIEDLKDKLKDAEDAARAAQDALDAAEDEKAAAAADRHGDASPAEAGKDGSGAPAEKAAPGPDVARYPEENQDGSEDDGKGPAYPAEEDGTTQPAGGEGGSGADASQSTDPGLPGATPESAKQKAHRLNELLDALEREAKALRKAKDRVDGAKRYTQKKMAKNAAFADVMEVQDEPDEDDAPDSEADEQA